MAQAAHADGPLPALPLPLYGSDTLFDVTRDIIAGCGLDANLFYKGTASGQGGRAMGPGDLTSTPPIPAHNQQIAPQSRFLNSSECNAIGPNRGNGITIALDAIAVVADGQPAPNDCDTLRHSRNTPAIAGYTFSDWRDVLRVVYTGQLAKISIDPCLPSDPARNPAAPGAIIGRCDGQVRQDLVANWSNLFENGCVNGKCQSGLRHAWRRDDYSGTTDMFLTLLGLPPSSQPSSPPRTFCNGFDVEDLDPIRRDCDPNEQVCSNTKYARRGASPEGANPTGTARGLASGSDSGDLGLLLTVTMPADPAKQFQPPCPAPVGGAFRRAPMPFSIPTETRRCPDGTTPKLGCLWPATSATGLFCLAKKSNIPGVRHPDFQFMDGRGYNQIPRDPTTGALLLPGNAAQIRDPRWGGAGFYKIHQTAAMANGVGACSQTTASSQIGCLVNADPCSIGFAGREALAVPGTVTKALKLRSPLSDAAHPAREVGPLVADINLVLDPSGQPAPANLCGKAAGDGSDSDFGYRYPFVRRHWLSASKGLQNVTNNVTASDGSTLPTRELDLLKCLQDRPNGITDGSITARGFLPLPDGAYPSSACGGPACGNGVVESGEQCDDGNLLNGDNCDANCIVGVGVQPCGPGSDWWCSGNYQAGSWCGFWGRCVQRQDPPFYSCECQ